MQVRAGATLALVLVTALLLAAARAGNAGGGTDRGGKPGAETSRSHAAGRSTRATLAGTLRSLRLHARGVVVQRGLRNYAGPRCPGKGWRCTTATRVIQIGTTASGRSLQARAVNKVDCAAATCEIVQMDAVNIARVKQKGSTDQQAVISQTGSSNTANVVQLLMQRDQFVFEARQKALVVQHAPEGGSNAASVNQLIDQRSIVRSEGAIVQNLEGDQFVDVQQDGANGAANDAATTQTLVENAVGHTTGAASTVNQGENTYDLDPSTPLNTSARIDQDSDTGPNTASRRQTHELTATATASTGNITQVQGSAEGGIDASSDDTVHQSSSGLSTSTVDQSEQQTLSAKTSPPGQVSQTQVGPLRCCSSQVGNSNDTFDIDQASTLTANDPSADQQSLVVADASSSGLVTVQQMVTIDGHVSSSSCSDTSCTTVTTGSSGLRTTNTDFAAFGFGGMRGIGTGSISVTGINGPVTKALLYWNGPTNSSDPQANASVTFNGTPITGTNIGFASDNCWGFQNSQSYRADVTSLVPGDGTYTLSNFVKGPNVEINGAALLVFYQDGESSNDRTIVLIDGNDSNFPSTFDPEGWDQTISGVDYAGSGSARFLFVVSDGQAYTDGALVVNGQTLVPSGPIFQGDSTPSGPSAYGSLWDVKSFDITSLLSPGSNTLHLTSPLVSDCLSLVVLAADVPAA